jgi:hypothetical protein
MKHKTTALELQQELERKIHEANANGDDRAVLDYSRTKTEIQKLVIQIKERRSSYVSKNKQ